MSASVWAAGFEAGGLYRAERFDCNFLPKTNPKPCVLNSTSICLDNKIANAYIKHLKGQMVIQNEGMEGIEL